MGESMVLGTRFKDYLITETGARRLGKKIPLTTEEVEALR